MDSMYDAIGGEETFRKMVHGFYQRVRNDDIIGPMYPHDDWEGAEDRLRWFLAQYWGGPQTFNEQRGHPALRMRHAQFPVDGAAAQRWLDLMSESLDEIEDLDPAHREAIWMHMERVAYMLINRYQ